MLTFSDIRRYSWLFLPTSFFVAPNEVSNGISCRTATLKCALSVTSAEDIWSSRDCQDAFECASPSDVLAEVCQMSGICLDRPYEEIEYVDQVEASTSKQPASSNKQDNFIVTVNRTAAGRGKSECKSPNRCSATNNGTGGWALNPNRGWSCDEQPKNTNNEGESAVRPALAGHPAHSASAPTGGANSATRCMLASQNSGEGSAWGNFINGRGSSSPGYLQDGTKVLVSLQSVSKTGVCALYPQDANLSSCPAPAQPPGTNDGPRQR
ncbi:hypothetical protein K488DRAFT_90339 [Vararia minispora EC-137]|uniref:Uncharacterized protein n=1 Tax=Vararia minispora EC-137 TaxID=1314806 RepID=A0ACB8Q7W0_9AGAM|nr:hypothetical protein K488DRAFT_90339 [Vararia minispora EC-137]